MWVNCEPMNFFSLRRLWNLSYCSIWFSTSQCDHCSHKGELQDWCCWHPQRSNLARVNRLGYFTPPTDRTWPAFLLSASTNQASVAINSQQFRSAIYTICNIISNSDEFEFSVAPKVSSAKDQARPAKLTLEHFYSSLMFWIGCVTVGLFCFLGEIVTGQIWKKN